MIRMKKTRILFYSLLTVLLVLCFVRYTFQLDIPSMLIAGVAMLMVFLGDRDETLAVCVCCIPLYTMFEYTYVLCVAICCYAWKYGKKIRLNGAMIPAAMMVLWELFHCFGEDFLITQFVGAFCPVLLLLLLVCSTDIRFDYAFICRSFAISIAAMCITLMGMLVYISNFNLMAALYELRRLGSPAESLQRRLLLDGAQMNPNALGVMCVLGMSGLFQLRNADRGKWSDTLLIVILLIFGVMTSSRTFLVCLALMALLLLFGKKGGVAKKVQLLMSILCVGLVAFVVLYQLVPDLLKYYYDRFFVEDITTGRSDTMKKYGDFIMSGNVLLWGIGLHDFDLKVLDVYRVTNVVPHNGIQELVIAWGLPGAVMFAVFLCIMCCSARKKNAACGLMNYIPFLTIMAKAQAGQLLNSPYTMLSLVFCCLSMYASLTNRKLSVDAEGHASEDESKAAGIELWRAAKYLWNKRAVIMGAALGSAAVAYAVTAVCVAPMYESNVLFYVNNRSTPAKKLSSGDISASRALTDTYIELLKSRRILDRVIADANVDYTPEELICMMTVYPVDDTEILSVTVEHSDPWMAEKIANTVAEIVPVHIATIIDGTSTIVLDYAVVASKPSSPSRVIHTLIGFMLGLIVVTVLLILQAMKKDNIKERSGITAVSSYPILAVIPGKDE